MNYEIHFVAPSSAASEVVRIVGESSQLDYRGELKRRLPKLKFE